MRAGTLRHRVKIQSPETTINATGERVHVWVDLTKVWASVEPLRGREYFAASQTQGSVDTLIRIRYRPDIHEKMRVVFVADIRSGLTHYYDITAVISVAERRQEMQLMCIRRSAEGFRSGV